MATMNLKKFKQEFVPPFCFRSWLPCNTLSAIKLPLKTLYFINQKFAARSYVIAEHVGRAAFLGGKKMLGKFEDPNFFAIGHYAEIVSHMFDGTCGYIYYVDNEEKQIWLSAGVCCSFDSAWNLTNMPEKETQYHRDEIKKGKNPARFFRENDYIIPQDMYLQDWKRKALWLLRKLYFKLINRKIGATFDFVRKKTIEWEEESF